MALAISHVFNSPKPAAADPTQIDGPKWNALHAISGTIDAAQLPPDLTITGSITAGGAIAAGSAAITGAVTAGSVSASGNVLGANLPAPGAAGTVLVGGSSPSYSATPSLTTLTAATAVNIGAGTLGPGSVFLQIGTLPSQSGLIRIPNNQAIVSRDKDNLNDYKLLYMGIDNIAHCDIGLAAQSLVIQSTINFESPAGWLIGRSGGSTYIGDSPPVIIRSSTVVEVDAPISFNGQTASHAGIRGVGATLQAIVGVGSGLAAFQCLSLDMNGAITMTEITAPAAPGTNQARIYIDNNGTKRRVMARFGTGAAVQIAIEP